MKIDITQWDRKPEENSEGLDGAIQVFVIDGVLIVPNPGIRPRYLVTDEEDPIVSRVRLYLIYNRARRCPSHNCRLHTERGTHCAKIKRRIDTTDVELPIRDIVIHVALTGV